MLRLLYNYLLQRDIAGRSGLEITVAGSDATITPLTSLEYLRIPIAFPTLVELIL